MIGPHNGQELELMLAGKKYFAAFGDVIPGHEWRKDCYLWLVKQLHEGKRSFGDADDIMIGRLLGYSTEDIQHFLEHRQTSKIY